MRRNRNNLSITAPVVSSAVSEIFSPNGTARINDLAINKEGLRKNNVSYSSNPPGKNSHLTLKDLSYEKELGHGGQGSANLYHFISDNGKSCVVMKEIQVITTDEIACKACCKQISNELNTYLEIADRKFCGFLDMYSAYTEDGKIKIALEFMKDGSLASKQLNESQMRLMVKQVLPQIAFLHGTLNVIHCDIKPANILKSGDKITIADFGSTQKCDGSIPFTYCGTKIYLPPEYYLREKFNDSYFYFAGDIWSLGVTLLELALGRHPFLEMEKGSTTVYHLVDYFGNQDTLNSLLYPLLAPFSEDFRDFILRCLKWDPKHRSTARQLLDSPFMSKPTAIPQKSALPSQSSR